MNRDQILSKLIAKLNQLEQNIDFDPELFEICLDENWDKVKKKGDQYLRSHAGGINDKIWTLWNSRKAELKGMGFAVSRYMGVWQFSHWGAERNWPLYFQGTNKKARAEYEERLELFLKWKELADEIAYQRNPEFTEEEEDYMKRDFILSSCGLCKFSSGYKRGRFLCDFRGWIKSNSGQTLGCKLYWNEFGPKPSCQNCAYAKMDEGRLMCSEDWGPAVEVANEHLCIKYWSKEDQAKEAAKEKAAQEYFATTKCGHCAWSFRKRYGNWFQCCKLPEGSRKMLEAKKEGCNCFEDDTPHKPFIL